MSIKKCNLTVNFFRGDYFEYYFRLIDDEGIPFKLSEKDKLIFSANKNFYSDKYDIQKSLGNGIEWNEENQCYVLCFNHEDTQGLPVADYDFDIVIVWDGTKPETHVGKLTLIRDVTRNEVE